MFKLSIAVLVFSFSSMAFADYSVNGSCAKLNIKDVQNKEIHIFEADAVKALKEKLGIVIVKASSQVQYTSSFRVTGDDINPWLEVRGTAQTLLKTSKGTVLEIKFKSSRAINSLLTRKLNPYDAWTAKPGFYIGLENTQTNARDNEGNVSGSATTCRIYNNVLQASIVNKATGIELLAYSYGDWYK
jgi:hypothetical protein